MVQTFFEIGIVSALLSNEFIGYYVRIYDPAGGVYSATHPTSLRTAAKMTIEGPVRAAGWDMRVAALDEENYRECRFSRNSGFLWSVADDKVPVFMLDLVEAATDQSVECMRDVPARSRRPRVPRSVLLSRRLRGEITRTT